jgi:hypothetical protein
MTMNRALEAAALDAHQGSQTWAEFWRWYGPAVAAAEPHDRQRYHRLRQRLLGLVVAGDLDGQEPPGDGWPRPCPWELADVREPTA